MSHKKIETHDTTMVDILMLHDKLRLDTIQPLDEFIECVLAYKNLGPTSTMVYDGVEIGIAGIFMFRPGVAHCWYIITDSVDDCKIAFCKFALRWRDFYWTEWNLQRMQAETESDFVKGNNFLKFVGFRYEGCMSNYGTNRQDYNTYAYIGD